MICTAEIVNLLEACLAGNLSMKALRDQLPGLEGLPLETGEPLRSTLQDAIHFLHHYEADEDIRSKDQEYAELQRADLCRFRDLIAAQVTSGDKG